MDWECTLYGLSMLKADTPQPKRVGDRAALIHEIGDIGQTFCNSIHPPRSSSIYPQSLRLISATPLEKIGVGVKHSMLSLFNHVLRFLAACIYLVILSPSHRYQLFDILVISG